MRFSILNSTCLLGVCLSAVAFIFFTACYKRGPYEEQPSKPNYNITFVALTDDNNLLHLNSDDCQRYIKKVAITGTASGEKILGIDYRPHTGQLYGIGNTSRLYVINVETGVARPLGAASFTPALNGTIVGFDFNPTVDRIRLVTNAGQNLRLNPETGMVAATDAALNPTNTSISGAAYTNNKAGAAATILYDIDVQNDKLYRQDPPNAGTLVEVGNLGIHAEEAGGFDITLSDIALAALRVNGQSNLYTVNLTNGQTTKIGIFNKSLHIIGLAVSTEPVAYAIDQNNKLLIFNPSDNNITPVEKAITGLQSGEKIVGLDMRPLNGQLYAMGNTNRLYTINAASGAAAAVGTGTFTTALNGDAFGFDFNPTVDRIRIVSNNGQNLRAHPETGAIVAADGNLNPDIPKVSAAAYTNNFAGATSTVLYVLDPINKKLYTQNPPNNGTLVLVGALADNFSPENGFDIGGSSGKAYALLNGETGTKLYQVNLQTAQLSNPRSITVSSIRGFTIGLGF
jgi:hypothetical protein